MTRAFSYDVDFQRDVQPGETFEILYERIADRGGNAVANGDVIYASMTLSGKTLRLYRYVAGRGLRAFRAVADEVDRQLLSLRQDTLVAVAHN